jgi:hypothetical protein
MAGLLGKYNDWLTPERSIKMNAIGTALSGLGSGQSVNLAPAYQALQKRKQDAAWQERMNSGEFAGMFDDRQMKALASGPSDWSKSVIHQRMFAAPVARKAPVFHDGQWWDVNGKVPQVVAGDTGGGPMFDGNSMTGQGLNHMVENGMITRDEAALLATQKEITGQDGALLLMTVEQMLGRKIERPADAGVTAPEIVETVIPTMGGPGAVDPSATPEPRVIVEGKEKPLTQDQAKAGGFVMRAVNAETILQEYGHVGTSTAQDFKSGVPVVGRYLESQDYKKLDQAKRSFINAVLRRDSGAVIGPTEFASADLEYFPQPADGDEVIAQKKNARRVAIDALRIAAPKGKPTEPLLGNPLNLNLENYP